MFSDPRLDPKAPKLTHKNWGIDPWEKARSDRLCRSLWPWVGAGFRRLPFHLLLFFTSPGALIRGFFQPCLCGAEFGFCGLGTGRFPTLGRKPPHRPSQARETRCFSAGKDGCCAPEGFSQTKPKAWSCTQGETGGAWVRAAGRKKPLPGFVGQRPGGCLIHLFSKNVPQRPHKRKAMRSVSWSVTRRKTGFPRMQAPT